MSERIAPTRTPAFEARLKKRYASERRFRALGLSAILFSIAVLVFLLGTMTFNGIGGFQRTFAIKRILPHLSEQPDFVDMLVEEAKIAGLLSHANIVQIMDLGQEQGSCFIAMEQIGFRIPPAFGNSTRRAFPSERLLAI